MKKTFREKWQETVAQKDSILCVGLDPADFGQRPGRTLPKEQNKLEWCMDFVRQVAPYSAAIKINRNYVKDFSQGDLYRLVRQVHDLGILAIDDTKLCDIGETNDAGLYHSAAEGFDAVTYSPFPGNVQEAVTQSHARGLGVFVLVLMSNPEFEVMKDGLLGGMKAYEFLARASKEAGADGVVIGAPSGKNHIQESEIRRVYDLLGDQLVLMPGLGAQGGEAKLLLQFFRDRVVANVGRTILYADQPDAEAKKYRDLLNALRLK